MKTMFIAFIVTVLIAIIASGVLSGAGLSSSQKNAGDAVRLDEDEQ
ncbi:hypothetical protein ROA7450_00712 [Roseovarius albus]|uniref:Uncharacterized protein n=1 Tax=Roseovarius albus TaxID=1247867 RepID=A0A1X6YGZ8_9RHOB|nr:hypothetical protein [Roseovarius albus]SLN20737.1 hypothetical protein ROA7450_00712 [Roseovarius albus]